MHLMRDLITDTPLVKVGNKSWKEEEKRPASGEIGTHNIPITRRVLYRCATPMAKFQFLKNMSGLKVLGKAQF